MIQITLVDVLILEDPTMTPWTSNNQAAKSIVDDGATLTKFAQAMEKMSLNYNFDYAVAVMKLLK